MRINELANANLWDGGDGRLQTSALELGEATKKISDKLLTTTFCTTVIKSDYCFDRSTILYVYNNCENGENNGR